MVVRGRLREPGAAPADGEEMREVLSCRNLVVEQILSAASAGSVPYLQEQDEWVVVLAGSASMTVGGEPVELGPRDWVFLPAGVPHTIERTEQGTSWLAVHLH